MTLPLADLHIIAVEQLAQGHSGRCSSPTSAQT